MVRCSLDLCKAQGHWANGVCETHYLSDINKAPVKCNSGHDVDGAYQLARADCMTTPSGVLKSADCFYFCFNHECPRRVYSPAHAPHTAHLTRTDADARLPHTHTTRTTHNRTLLQRCMR